MQSGKGCLLAPRFRGCAPLSAASATMSRLHELVVDLGAEVDEFASRIEEEKRKIAEMKTQFDHQLKRRLDKEEEDGYASALEANLERLQKDLSVSASTAVTTTGEPHLIKALGEVRAAAQRMRDERMEILGEYRAKLDQCEGLCRRNSMLEAFIDTWSKRLAEGKHLSELPEVVKKLSEETAQFYSTPVHRLLEEALVETTNTISDSAMDVSEVSASTTEAIVPPLTPPETAKSLTAETTRSCLMDETICNAMTADASMCRVSGCSEPSILLDEGDVGELNRLDRPDTMPTDQQGTYLEEGRPKLMQVRNDTTIHQDRAL